MSQSDRCSIGVDEELARERQNGTLPDAGLVHAIHRIRDIGPRFDLSIADITAALYQPVNTTGTSTLIADCPFGVHERQRLDIYRPNAAAAGSPVILFVPGGGYVTGDKQVYGGLYGRLANFFADHGYLTAVMNYRLAPEFAWPSGIEDVRAAFEWLHANIAQHGGNPRRIAIFGQSAGATHAAGYLFGALDENNVAPWAGILLSGVYRFTEEMISPAARQYFGNAPSLYAERSPIVHVDRCPIPILVGVAEFDPPNFVLSAFDLAEALTRRDGQCPDFALLAAHNHVSTVFGLGSGHDDAGARIVAFLERLGAKRGH